MERHRHLLAAFGTEASALQDRWIKSEDIKYVKFIQFKYKNKHY